jgi:hypothetical protein
VLSTSDGHVARGVVDAVGLDHVSLRDGTVGRWVAIAHIVSVEVR